MFWCTSPIMSIHKPRGVLAALFLLAAPSYAATFFIPQDRELVRGATTIVAGSVLDSRPQLSRNGYVETVTSVSVREVLKGALITSTIDIHEPGGVYGDRVLMIPGVPQFERGRDVLLFLVRTPQQTWAVHDLALGKFDFARDARGQRVVVRDDDVDEIDQRRAADRFLQFVRTEAVGGVGKSDYFVGRSPIQIAPDSFRIAVDAFTATSYTMDIGGGRGSRWNVFPSAVNWYTGATQEPGAPGGGVTAVQTAIAAWNNDTCSNVNYVYAGTDTTHTAGLSGPDGRNTVLFERNLSSYGISPFTCSGSSFSGVLGLGGVTNASGTHTFNNETFFTTLEGDVEMNQGIANCSALFTGGGFNSGVTHELGHTLGFRHSDQTRADNPGVPCSSDPSLECSSSAIMRSSVPSGLNANLQPWDVNAVRAVYAAGCTTTPPPNPPPSTTLKRRGDFNGDGTTDVLWRNTSTGHDLIWFMSGAAVTGGSATFIVDLSFTPYVGDFNGDDRADILWYNQNGGMIDIWLLNGTGSPFARRSYISMGGAWRIGGIRDFNGDGKDDVLWRNTSTGNCLIWYLNGTTVANGSATFTVDLAFSPYPGDFNGDGKADIAWYSASRGVIDIWLLNGTPTRIGGAAYTSMAAPWQIAGVADFDGDNREDLLWRNTSNGDHIIWYIVNGTVARGSAIFPVSLGFVPHAGDFNGDRKADLVWYNASSGVTNFWILNGTPKPVAESTYYSMIAPWQMYSP